MKNPAIPLTCKTFCANPPVALLGVGARGQNYADTVPGKAELYQYSEIPDVKKSGFKAYPFSHEIIPLTIST